MNGNRLRLSYAAASFLLTVACVPDDRTADQLKTTEQAVNATPSGQNPKPTHPADAEGETDIAEMLSRVPPRDKIPNRMLADLAISPMPREAPETAYRSRALPPILRPPLSGERYEDTDSNPVTLVSRAPVSTFSVDVDTAAYANLRRFLKDGMRPPVEAVRIEELINYFDYAYASPQDLDQPFATDIALFSAPWDAGKQLLRIGIKGYDIKESERPRANLVFLVDTSGSMADPDKLPLVKRSLRLLVQDMRDDDRIAIVAYAGRAGIVLEPTGGAEKARIIDAIEGFSASGSTAGADGLREAYRLAEASFDEGSVNRVILATDGDFNVGISDPDRLEDVIAAKRQSGVYLSVMGFGRGNLNDHLMQRLAQAGNGNASYIDGLMEARKVLLDEMSSTLFPIADDVKIQIEFNPKKVAEYRLIGYETRMLKQEDFNNNRVDAGEIGSGHTVTALYEITPPDSSSRLFDDLRYAVRRASVVDAAEFAGEVAWLRLRYKRPGEDFSQLIEQPVPASGATAFDQAPQEARFAAAVAGFGEILRQSVHVGTFDLRSVLAIAGSSRGEDPFGYRSEFMQLVRLAQSATRLGVEGG